MTLRSGPFGRLVYILYFPYMVLFLGFVGGGWYISLATTNKALDRGSIGAILLVIIGLIYGFARHTGAMIHRWRLRRCARWAVAVTFVPLLLLSAVGFVSAAMLLLEGPAIVRDNLARSIEQISQLRGQTPTLLRPAEYEDLRGKVLPLRDQLAVEIVNPSGGRYCGIGPSARNLLNQIQVLLPSVHLINGTDNINDCRDATRLRAIADQYRLTVDQALANHEATLHANLPERAKVRDESEVALRTIVERLRTLQSSLAGVGTFIFNYGLYQGAVAELETAAAVYSDRLQRLKALLPGTAITLVPRLDVTVVEQVASPTQLGNLVLARLFDPATAIQTLAYVLGAVTADGMAAFAVSAVFLRRREDDDETIDRAAHVDVQGSGARYLWIPMRPPAP